MLLYFTTIVAEDEESQRKGMVVVLSPKMTLWEAYQMSTREHHKDCNDLHKAMPVRLSALHLCLPDGPTSKMLSGLIMFGISGEGYRLHIRIHSPLSNLETRYQLMSFGLPVHEFPISSTGTLKNRIHLQWLRTRTLIENSAGRRAVFQGIIYPGVHDVLFSKGGNTSHYGNIEFRCMLDSTCPVYNMTMDRSKRRQFRRRLIDFVTKERKGRFLQPDPEGNDWWTEITDMDMLMEKVRSALYDHNRKLTAQAKQQKSESETRYFINDPKRRKLSDGVFCCSRVVEG
jgi:hypothetical protein